jgi:hypothetical protein
LIPARCKDWFTKPRNTLRFHTWNLYATIALWALATKLGWVHSAAFISHISMAALVYTLFGNMTAADAAIKAEEAKEEAAVAAQEVEAVKP